MATRTTSSEALRFDHRRYVPCVRWKQGEYQALMRLSENAKNSITPLIDVPELGWDFEEQRQAKTIDEHLKPLPKRIREKWGRRWAFVDLHLIDADARLRRGVHPVDWVFKQLREHGCGCIPVTGVNRDPAYQNAIVEAAKRDGFGVCIRVGLETVAKASFKGDIDKLLKMVGVGCEDIHFILDLDAPNFDPLEGFTKMTMAVIGRIPHLNEWRTFSVIGTSFPKTMGELRTGLQLVERREWQFYKMLSSQIEDEQRLPSFGDYTIAHPDVLRMDMRLVRPAASIRYTVDDAWLVIKGTSMRKDGNQQFIGHCRELVKSLHYRGTDFSAGDGHIDKCSKGAVNPGNLSTWRWVGTNHHIERVVDDLANLFSS